MLFNNRKQEKALKGILLEERIVVIMSENNHAGLVVIVFAIASFVSRHPTIVMIPGALARRTQSNVK